MIASRRRLVLPFCALILVSACKKKGGEESNLGNVPPPSCTPGTTWNGQACVPTTSNPPPPTTGSTTPPPPPGPAGKATPLDAQSSAAATAGLGALAQQSAPGAKPVAGSLLAGNFQQGQTLDVVFSVQPGRCYTVVGAGLPNVQNLDLAFIAETPLPGFSSPVLATDQTVGPNATLAPQPNCWKWALPMAGTLKLVMTVSSGSGMAAAQVYEK